MTATAPHDTLDALRTRVVAAERRASEAEADRDRALTQIDEWGLYVDTLEVAVEALLEPLQSDEDLIGASQARRERFRDLLDARVQDVVQVLRDQYPNAGAK